MRKTAYFKCNKGADMVFPTGRTGVENTSFGGPSYAMYTLAKTLLGKRLYGHKLYKVIVSRERFPGALLVQINKYGTANVYKHAHTVAMDQGLPCVSYRQEKLGVKGLRQGSKVYVKIEEVKTRKGKK